MKNFKNIFTLLVVALAGLSLTACSNNDLDTDQFQGGVALNVYGPSPVMRGGQLRFIGSNLDQVREVIIPSNISITNIQVVRAGTPSEIRVTVPKDGPVEGFVTLVTNSDQRITTKTPLKYEEGIEITAMPTKAMPGDVIKIEGDYLNLIHSLAFADDVLISEEKFTSHSRYAIEVKVPEEAKTGKLELYTADLTVVDKNSVEYQIIKTDEALEVGTPAIAKVKGREEAAALGNIVAKAGEKITITGTYFNVVADVTIGGVSATDITISEDGTTLTATLPAAAPSGEIILVCKSGVEVPVGTLTTVKPTNAVAAATAKAGQALTINGQDMDLVTAVTFPAGDATVDGGELTVAAAKVIVKAVPETATEGNLKLVMANGETVDVAFTLVKPAITGYNNNPVSAGGVLQITGTNLDLVKSIEFGTGKADVAADNVSADGKKITITVPMDAQSGKPKFNLANGTSVEGADLQIAEAVFCYITEMPEFDEEHTPAAGDVFTVTVANGDKLTSVFVNNTEVRYVYSEKNNTLTIGIPADAGAKSTLKLVSSNGEIAYNITVIPQGKITNVIFNGPFELTWNTSTQGMIPATVFDNLPEGKVSIIFDYTVTGSDAKMKVNNGSWEHIILETGAAPESETLYSFDESGKLIVPLSSEAIANLKAKATDWGGILIVHGQNAVINKISLEIEIPQETVLWEGSQECAGQPYLLSDGGAEFKDNEVKAGQTIHFYITVGGSDWWFEAFEGHWGPQYGHWDGKTNPEITDSGKGVVDIVLTQDMINAALNQQGWGGIFVLQGPVTLTKITVE